MLRALRAMAPGAAAGSRSLWAAGALKRSAAVAVVELEGPTRGPSPTSRSEAETRLPRNRGCEVGARCGSARRCSKRRASATMPELIVWWRSAFLSSMTVALVLHAASARTCSAAALPRSPAVPMRIHGLWRGVGASSSPSLDQAAWALQWRAERRRADSGQRRRRRHRTLSPMLRRAGPESAPPRPQRPLVAKMPSGGTSAAGLQSCGRRTF